ncbi:HAMP domain-containing sensor histidine kinase [Corallococcus macrosporus]|uniref:histidine kinase n=1 Tax=Corallococcus macrosporus DSM 14697 TaxID=1189310 RepID=A0A250K092_9BACT|nr:HAMP domain-containing sensor histidine kinase [Corallococcus macrosporus]ATB49529.1 two-component sensor histidine kinase [Corallococcus macrosporus DSM 14697]
MRRGRPGGPWGPKRGWGDAHDCGPWGHRHPPHGYWHMGRLGGFVRARLHRRLFMWFGLSILATGAVVATVMSLVGGGTWKQEGDRVRTFVGHQFEEVWDEPARRNALVESIARDLQVGVELRDTSGAVLARTKEPCRRPEFNLPVVREGVPLGTVRACYASFRPKSPLRMALPLVLSCMVLWLAAGKLARRLARPMDELVRATRELGSGRLDSRADIAPHVTGEFAVLADAFNDMAGRIEKQVADQRELLAAVSHELRTPLARLRVLTELLRDRGGNPKTLDQVDREVVELDALVGELLASSRLDFGQLTPRVLDGQTLASQALERAGLASTLLDVQAEHAGLVGDATLLGRALANLLENARKHGAGADALRLQERGEHLAFCVEDRGPGLQPGEDVRIFRPFYRKDHGTEAREAGSLGLGLALVQRIAHAHGGEVFAENRPGGGARVGFTVRKSGPPDSESRPAA